MSTSCSLVVSFQTIAHCVVCFKTSYNVFLIFKFYTHTRPHVNQLKEKSKKRGRGEKPAHLELYMRFQGAGAGDTPHFLWAAFRSKRHGFHLLLQKVDIWT